MSHLEFKTFFWPSEKVYVLYIYENIGSYRSWVGLSVFSNLEVWYTDKVQFVSTSNFLFLAVLWDGDLTTSQPIHANSLAASTVRWQGSFCGDTWWWTEIINSATNTAPDIYPWRHKVQIIAASVFLFYSMLLPTFTWEWHVSLKILWFSCMVTHEWRLILSITK